MLTPAERFALDAAYEQAEKSLREGGYPIGSALLDPSGTIIALGHNLREQTSDTTAHAETVCMRNAKRRRDWHTLTLVSTLSPCAMCSGTAVLHRIKRVVIGENRNFKGEEDWMRSRGIDIEVVDDPRCIRLMAQFIKKNKDRWNEDIGVPPKRSRRTK